MLIQGENDPDSLPSDAQQLAADYGPKGAAVVMIAGGGRVPRIESAPHKDLFWDAVTTFTRGLP